MKILILFLVGLNFILISGMVTAMDDAVGNVIRALKQARMFKKTIIIFTSDVNI